MSELSQNSTFNVDVAGLVRRLDRVVTEITKSQSSPLAQVRTADTERIAAYIKEAQSYADFVSRKPELDFPKTHGVALPLAVAPVIAGMENDALWDLAQLFDSARFEVANSASSRAPSGLIDPDKKAAFEALCASQDQTPSQVVRQLIRDYLDGLKKQPKIVTSFRGNAFNAVAEKITVMPDGSMVVRFKDGREVSVEKPKNNQERR